MPTIARKGQVVGKVSGVKASPRRLRTLSAELRKLPDHDRRKALGVRSTKGRLSVVFTEGNTQRWIRLDVPIDATDAQITAAVSRALAQSDEQKEEQDVPIATGQLSRLRRRCLAELDLLELTERTRKARGRHVDDVIRYMQERSLTATAENLLAYIRSTDREKRERRDAATASRLLLRTASGVELALRPSDHYKQPSVELGEPDDPEQTLEAIKRLWELDVESAWLTSWVALTGCRSSMLLASELMHKTVPIEIGSWINCRDNTRGRNRNSRILPSWRKCLEQVGGPRLAKVPQVFVDVRLPYNSPPSTEAHAAAELVLARMSNRMGRMLPEANRSILKFKSLRHQRVSALLDAGIQPLRVAEIVSTGLEPLLKRYSDHHRFRAADDVKGL